MVVLVWIVFCIALALLVLKLYLKLTTGWCRSNVCLVGKTAIITGANAGIGYATAEDFAKRGARVILACRDESRGTDAVARIIKTTDNNNIVFKQMDLSSLKSVREFAKDINAMEERLDILVNNAGVGTGHNKYSEDGLQLFMQINYFGHFLLTNLLLDLLKNTSNSRIVNVSSIIAKYHKTLNVNNLNFNPKELTTQALKDLYSKSKLCIILFTIELAKRLNGTGVTAYSIHPGIVQTDFFKDFTPIMKWGANLTSSLLFKCPSEGAQSSIYCSIAKDIENMSGHHFAECQLVSRYKAAQLPDLPEKLWKMSEQLVKL